MTGRTTLIMVPTWNRPHHIGPFLDALHRHTDGTIPHHVLFLVQEDDQPTRDQIGLHGGDVMTFARRDDGEPQTICTKGNAAYKATTEPYFVGLSDDTRALPGWLYRAHEAMTGETRMVCLNDQVPGHVHDGELTGHVLIERAYISRFSGVIDEPDTVMHEGYWHYFSDMELWQTARSRGVYKSCFEAKIDHPHPNAGTAERDRVHEWSINHMAADRRTYEQRKHLWERVMV